MSDTDQNTGHLPESTPGDVKQKVKPTVQQKTDTTSELLSGGSGKGLAGFGLLLSACALGFSGYIGWRAMVLEQGQPVLREGMDQLQTQIARQQARLTTTEQNTITDMASQQAQLQALEQRAARLLSRVDTLSAKVRELDGSTRNQWRIAEVEYLLHLANQQLLMANDATGAFELMASAGQILEQLDDYGLFSVKEAMAEDMALLKTVETVDQQRIWLRLQAMENLIPELVVLDDGNTADMASNRKPDSISPPDDGAEADPADRTWQHIVRAMLLDTWYQFTSLFRINTQREQPIEVLLTAEQDQLIRQKMVLMIEQGQLALLTGQSEIYHNSLQQVSDWLNRYFMLGDDVSRQLASELADLESLSITPGMPAIHRSLDALKEYLSSDSIPATPQQDTAAPAGSGDKMEPATPNPNDGKNSSPLIEPAQSEESGVQIS